MTRYRPATHRKEQLTYIAFVAVALAILITAIIGVYALFDTSPPIDETIRTLETEQQTLIGWFNDNDETIPFDVSHITDVVPDDVSFFAQISTTNKERYIRLLERDIDKLIIIKDIREHSN